MSERGDEKVVLPKLRFPEFRNASYKLADAGQYFTTVNERNTEGGFPILAITQEQGAVPRDSIDYSVAVTDASLATYKVVREGDFIISLRSFQGGIERSAYTGVCSPAYIILRANRDLEAEFYRHYFKAPSYIAQLNHELEGIRDGKMISYSQFARIPLPMPIIAEQRKIADCLQSLDELIAAQTEKLEALKLYKKGLLLQLFPADDEATPRIRFPQFDDICEWKEVTLAELIDSLDAGVSVNSGDRPAMAHEIGVLKTSAVTRGTFESQENKVVFAQVEIDRVREPVTKDTIIISRSNTSLHVGANAYVEASFGNIFLSDKLWAAKCKPQASALFLSIVLGSDAGRAALAKLARGSSASMKNISKEDVFAMRFLIPSAAEQKRIAEFILSLQERIRSQTEKIHFLRTHKAALMQQLFPILAESNL